MEWMGLLERVSGAFERELRGADLSARCAALRWSVQDLAAHLGAVHVWAAGNVRTGRRGERVNVPELTVPAPEFYAAARAELLATLRELDPEQECWTLDRQLRQVKFWHRRQAYETLVHLWDLRSAADPAAPPPPEATPAEHADAVAEFLTVFVPRGPADRPPLPGSLALRAADTGDRWVLATDWTRTDGPADTELTGPAGDLLLFIWGRTGVTGALSVRGSEAPLEPFLPRRR